MDSNVLLAILAMDSYNHNYEPGYNGIDGSQIGPATAA